MSCEALNLLNEWHFTFQICDSRSSSNLFSSTWRGDIQGEEIILPGTIRNNNDGRSLRSRNKTQIVGFQWWPSPEHKLTPKSLFIGNNSSKCLLHLNFWALTHHYNCSAPICSIGLTQLQKRKGSSLSYKLKCWNCIDIWYEMQGAKKWNKPPWRQLRRQFRSQTSGFGFFVWVCYSQPPQLKLCFLY